MKKLALVAALAAAFTGSAFAQSSVTLYGRINTSLELQKLSNVSDEKYLMNNNASRWGLRGTEDLGGGLNAFFQLESGFASDTGAGSGGFNRDAYVGLKSASLGQIKMGHFVSALYYSTIDYIGNFNHDTGTTSEDNIYLLSVGFNNGVEYTSPAFGPVTFALTQTASEGTGNKVSEGVVNFDKDTLHVGVGYSKTENRLKQDLVEGFSAAVSYGFGPVNLGVAYERDDIKNAAVIGAIGKRNQITATAQYNLGAAEFHLSGGFAGKIGNVANSDAKQYTVGVNYNLSKRTKVYGFFYKIDNKAAASYVTGVNGVDLRSFAAFGIRHNF